MTDLLNPNPLTAQNNGICPGSIDDDPPPPVTPLILTRAAAYRQCQTLKALHAVAVARNTEAYEGPHFEGQQLDRVTCVLVDRSTLDPLLPAVKPAGAALVLFLTPEMEPSLGTTLAQGPGCMNHTTTDLLHNFTFHYWDFDMAGIRKSVWLWDKMMSDLTDGYYACSCEPADGQAPDNEYESHCTWKAEVVPVVMVSGETVAVGGFWATEVQIFGSQAATSSSGPNWKPYRIFEDDEMEAAALEAQRIGNYPWYLQFHELEPDWHVTVPGTLDCRCRAS